MQPIPCLGGFDVDDFRRRFSAKKQRVYNNDTTLALHSLRHGFKAAGRATGVPGDLLDYLTGHAPASSSSVAMSFGQGYAKAYPVLRGSADSIEAHFSCPLCLVHGDMISNPSL